MPRGKRAGSPAKLITMPAELWARIDAAAGERGRSTFLALAAERELKALDRLRRCEAKASRLGAELRGEDAARAERQGREELQQAGQANAPCVAAWHVARADEARERAERAADIEQQIADAEAAEL